MGIRIKRIGHIGLLVSDFEQSFRFYTEVLGCTVTFRRKGANGSETAFLRFEDWHHDLVLTSADRDEFLKALAHLHAKGVKLINGPLIHGLEGGNNLAGSGSRSFYFNDPDGNRLEIYTDMMRVPNGEEFPRQEYAAAMREYLRHE
jgi:catechol 2,3-dioxygenase